MRPSLSVVLVAFNSGEALRVTLPALLAELEPGDEVVLVDNDSADDSAAVATALAPAARIVRMDRNAGFTGGANAGARAARGDLLVVLNPDAAPRPGWGEEIRRPWREGRGWAAWQGLVAEAGGELVNSAGNPVHFTGIVWAGDHGLPVAAVSEPREVVALSGACLAVPRSVWRRLGGLPEKFFMYHEDVDLALRLRLAGEAVGIEPRAIVDHDYEFDPANDKWRWMERNRLATLVRLWPTSLLALCAPALLATELALLPAAAAGGWLRAKLRADWEFILWTPRLLRERRRIQSERQISAADFAAALSVDLDSPFFPAAVRSGAIRFGLRAYWRGVRVLLRGL